MIRLGTQPEDHVYWTQYRFLPCPSLYLQMDDRWLDVAGWDSFDIQNGYALEAPNALPAGCQAARHGFFGIANVPREWEAHEAINETIEEYSKEIGK